MSLHPISRLAHFWRRGLGNLRFAAGLYPTLNAERWGIQRGGRKSATVAEPTRVLVIVPHMVAGGADRVVLQIIRGLPTEEFEVHTVATRPNVHEWLPLFQECSTTVSAPADVIMLQPLWNRAFRELVRALRIDLVFSTNSDAFYRGIKVIAPARPLLPFIDLIHSPASIWTPWPFPYAYGAIHTRLCVSDALRYHMIDEYAKRGISGNILHRLQTQYIGLDLDLYSPGKQQGRGAEFRAKHRLPADAPIVVYLGRFSEEKDPVLFARLAAEFQRRNPASPAQFVLAGDGEDRAAVEKVVAGATNPGAIRLVGMLPESEVLALLGTAHTLVMTSTTEGIPYAMLEALAMRVSFVSTRVGAIPEVIEDGVSGFLVPRDGKELAGLTTAIETLLGNPERRASMLDAAEKALRPRFELQAMQRAYTELFRASARWEKGTARK